jgi:hypothetical protein
MTDPRDNDAPPTIGLYVINLDSSSMPIALRVPFRHELVGFSVFRSRTVEDGRERFRLHLGYFESPGRAEEALAVVRKYYPGAFISMAPAKNLSSLEDTFMTEFRTVRSAYARVVPPGDVDPPPVAVGAKVVSSDIVREPVFKEPRAGDTKRASAPQRYAVQLEWSVAPIIAADIPPLAIFDAYSLYTVREQREGLPQTGLRLGFFSSADSARQVADYVRAEFSTAAVIPVSAREVARALEAARERALKAVASGELQRPSEDSESPPPFVRSPPTGGEG